MNKILRPDLIEKARELLPQVKKNVAQFEKDNSTHHACLICPICVEPGVIDCIEYWFDEKKYILKYDTSPDGTKKCIKHHRVEL